VIKVPTAIPEAGSLRGRGTSTNPANRFEEIHYEPDPFEESSESPAAATRFFKDPSRSILSFNDSPDIPFEVSVNPYRGCEHGCIYCYARPTHEYLGFSAGLDFESRILVKEDAPELLRKELSKKSWRPTVIAMSGVTDCYQPIERKLCITRRCLEVLAEFRNPVGVITKSGLVTRDIDLFQSLARSKAVEVTLSITSLDDSLAGVLEPRAARPRRRLEVVQEIARAGIPATVMLAPIIPGLNDHEIPALLEASREAGALGAGWQMLRLPHGVGPLFEQWLGAHFPDRKDKVLNRIREMRGGRLNDSRFGERMRGEGVFAEQIEKLFRLHARRLGLLHPRLRLSTAAFRLPGLRQGLLFRD